MSEGSFFQVGVQMFTVASRDMQIYTLLSSTGSNDKFDHEGLVALKAELE